MARKFKLKNKKVIKRRYSKLAKKQVKKELRELRANKLTMNKHGGKKITSKKHAIAKALNIADSKKKK